MLAVGVVGGTGYTGAELLRLLVMHPEVELKHVTSRSESGSKPRAKISHSDPTWQIMKIT